MRRGGAGTLFWPATPTTGMPILPTFRPYKAAVLMDRWAKRHGRRSPVVRPAVAPEPACFGSPSIR